MTALTKVQALTAVEVCRLYELDPEAGALLDETSTPASFIERLMGEQRFADAARFLAYALPKREAVWWACLCARAVTNGETSSDNLAALDAAEAWVYKPIDENRRKAMEFAEKTKMDTSASWAAVAAFWSAGSMAPADAPVVPPGEELTGAAVSGAVILAAVQKEPEKAPEKYARFLTQGLEVARGGSGRDAL
jgi:hypothetical protein